MNTRQKAKVYKKQRDYLYRALLNSVYENQKIGEEIEQSIIDIHGELRYGDGWQNRVEEWEDVVIADLIAEMTRTEEFKQSVAVEKYRDPLTDEMVYRAHLQTIRPKMEED